MEKEDLEKIRTAELLILDDIGAETKKKSGLIRNCSGL